MGYGCTVIADSVNAFGQRITTMVVTIPRIMLAEFNTHRLLSRNSASSRAIPVYKQLVSFVKGKFQPEEYGTAVGGMNAGKPLEADLLIVAKSLWEDAAVSAVWYALCLTTSEEYIEREWAKWNEVEENHEDFDEFVLEIARRIGDKKDPIHNEALLWTTKGLTNRLLEPFMWQTIIVTGTEWENFINLRTDDNAQLEIRHAADMMKKAYEESIPVFVEEGAWHLPFIQPGEMEWAKLNPELARKAVVARCARVSYLTHDKKVIDLEADFRLADSLATNGHMSPFEHAATPFTADELEMREDERALAESYRGRLPDYVIEERIESSQFSANFRGWGSYRREIPGQRVYVRK